VQLVGANEVAVQCDKKVDEEVDDDDDGDDADADAEVVVVDDKQHLKFKKALLKCVKGLQPEAVEGHRSGTYSLVRNSRC
jgi:hypothetical protein